MPSQGEKEEALSPRPGCLWPAALAERTCILPGGCSQGARYTGRDCGVLPGAVP